MHDVAAAERTAPGFACTNPASLSAASLLAPLTLSTSISISISDRRASTV